MSNPKYYIMRPMEAKKLPEQFKDRIFCMARYNIDLKHTTYKLLENLDSPSIFRKCVAVELEEEDLSYLALLGISVINKATKNELKILSGVRQFGHYESPHDRY